MKLFVKKKVIIIYNCTIIVYAYTFTIKYEELRIFELFKLYKSFIPIYICIYIFLYEFKNYLS